MKVYTKTGDKGTTSLLSGERVEKDTLRVDAYGTVDELDSVLGMARAFVKREDVRETIYSLQKLLGMLMADVASLKLEQPYITTEHVNILEQTIDKFDALLQPLTKFLVPGDTQGAAMLDLARTVTRRAERRLITLSKQEAVNHNVLVCLNRISDLCFILARVEVEVK
ncbi:cob(I)yrinic acid a,c-diamide adenosyltransferase [Succinispira mobilis]|uniref:cob(I)yrinic acid a,c-diamide adenosyltransferase n=1 Tax=Succinispira mobilis TaxID=78120 RepID=UPI00035CA87B|nr:cob(I)yrinic acid a,c-diamide adenosyltransferase [Succinispira mobilis]